MQNMNIESGEVCNQYLCPNTKHERKELHLALRAKGKEGEKREGIKYSSGIATELSTLQDEICKTLLNINMRDVENSEKEAKLPANIWCGDRKSSKKLRGFAVSGGL